MVWRTVHDCPILDFVDDGFALFGIFEMGLKVSSGAEMMKQEGAELVGRQELLMDQFQVTAQVADLAESHLTMHAGEGLLLCMPFQMVPNIRALVVNAAAMWKQAAELPVAPACLVVPHVHDLVQVLGYSFELLIKKLLR